MDAGKTWLKAAAYVALLGLGAVFFIKFYQAANEPPPIMTPEPAASSGGPQTFPPRQSEMEVLKYALCFILAAICFAFLFAFDFCQFAGSKAVDALFDMNADSDRVESFQRAERLLREENPLEAIEALRSHLDARPRDVHAAMKIAEIYEDDMGNPLAAALEYEEILEWRVAARHWERAAVRAAKLYAIRLGRRDRAVEIMRLIDARNLNTSATVKIRRALARYDGARNRFQNQMETTTSTTA